MKKIITTTVLSVAGLCLLAPTALAEKSETAKRTTDAGFSVSEDGTDPVTPGGEDPIKPDPDPVPPINGITLTHAPNISFGTDNKISINEVNYKALREKVTVTGNNVDYFSPHFVQVADASGGNSEWSVSVAQRDPYLLKNDKVTSSLENTRIRLYGNTIVGDGSTEQSSVDKVKKVTGFVKTTGADYAAIPVSSKESGSLVVEAVNDTAAGVNGGVSGEIISSVFEDDYKLSDYYTGTASGTKGTEGRYEGIQLNVPKKEAVKEGTYEAILDWTLTVGP